MMLPEPAARPGRFAAVAPVEYQRVEYRQAGC
jgi:hypothetical protein